ncbi:MAG: SirB2 family protein [Gammaproteobacteria bacterium]|nr:SirB2 family protein [Gammaproteobacteria bacterium]
MHEYYSPLKSLHISCAALSITLYLLRNYWMLRHSPLLNSIWARVVPHVIDTLFLASGILLTVIIGQYPFTNTWLSAKVVGLIVYIGLGFMAMRGGTATTRTICFAASLLIFAYIVSVAVSKNALPWL